MTGLLEHVSSVFRNAVDFDVESVVLDDEAISAISRHAIGLMRMLADEDDPTILQLRHAIARLRATVVMSLRPFSSPDLRLPSQCEHISQLATGLGAMRPRLDEFTRLVEQLAGGRTNEKREDVFRRLRGPAHQDNRPPLGVVFAVAGVPGWSTALSDEIHEYGAEVIISRRQLLSRTYCELILPWSGNQCAFASSLYSAYRSSKLTVVRYSAERPYRPPRRSLPVGRGTICGRREWPDEAFQASAVPSEADIQLVHESFFDFRLAASQHAAVSDRTFLVGARLVLFADGTAAFLKEDSDVMEFSQLLDRGGGHAVRRDRVPRVRVKELSPGDLIVLRTSGSGDYLESVADVMLNAAGKGDLRARALDWKFALKRALEERGSREVFDRLGQRGFRMSSGHSYIWHWTTNGVIRPESEGLFYELLAILQDLGFLDGDVLTTAEQRWKDMNEIVAFHMRAGFRIRKALLAELQRLLETNAVVPDCLRITLPDADAGELSLIRVLAVDEQSTVVPFSQLNALLRPGV